MRFAFTTEQLEIRDAVRAVLAKECTPADLRAAYEAPGWRTDRWSTLAELGVLGMAVPEARGGLGLGMVDVVVVLEEAGRVALPEPLAATAALAAPLLVDLEAADPGGDDRRRDWLEGMAAGREAAAVAAGSGPEPVAGADGASLYVVLRPAPNGDPGLWLVDADDADSTRATAEPVPSLDPTRRLATVATEGTPPDLVGDLAGRLARRTALRGAVATAAELVGLAERLVTLGADYARDRTQFE
ncbi:MAG: acyl-CoA dehydrogenase family protein, partial [Acidimicrobiales bacterium]|nr:acyl-CoA dehydrogenase family protein [Acidimicrobiales bacterium]